MQKDFKDIQFLFPAEIDWDDFISQPADEPFSEETISFLNALSVELSTKARIYPEIGSLAFFCRKANLLQLKSNYGKPEALRLGRGIVFHIAPSNVPLNFAYSLVCGLLSGNCNIVRVPSLPFEQISIVCEAIQKVQLDGNFVSVANRILLIRYNKQLSATAYFSSVCDVRIIWGGDETIDGIRKCNLPPRSFDITFADRYSICIINADKYCKEDNPSVIAKGFYNDTYLFDQNACTSPHLLVWLGKEENVSRAKDIFWTKLHETVLEKYNTIQPVIAVDKLASFYAQSVSSTGISKVISPDNTIWRVTLKEIPVNIDSFRCAGGYFSEYHASSLQELAPIINRKYQTLAYYGIPKTELEDFVRKNKLSGIDRMTPIGRTSEFSITWDGFELITTLTRTIDII